MPNIYPAQSIESLLAAKLNKAPNAVRTASGQSKDVGQTRETRDLVLRTAQRSASNSPASQLIEENIEETDDGFIRFQEFARGGGNSFTRKEEIRVTPSGFERTVTQESANGLSSTLREDIETRDVGVISRIQRFTDPSGETLISVDDNFRPDSPIILPDGNRVPSPSPSNAPSRGQEIDISA